MSTPTWPSPDDGDSSDLFGYLFELFKKRPELANEFSRDTLFDSCSESLQSQGKPLWEKSEFVREFAEAVGETEIDWSEHGQNASFQRIRSRARRQQKILNLEDSRQPGRQPSDRTAIARTIREGLGYSRSRAYEIVTEGTTRLEDRRALAKLFADDPEMSRPSYWEPKFKARRPGRPSGAPTFRDYVMSGVDDFEGDVSVVLDMLRRAYEFGALSDDFDTLESFLVTARLAGINDAAVTVELWERAKAWRNSSAN